jgi:hypothetical protein
MPPSILKIATTTTFVGLTLAALGRSTRARPANRLLLYRYADRKQFFGDKARVGIALGATITPNGFYIERPVQMDAWDFIASARSGGKNWLLLSNLDTQTVATGLIDENFVFKVSQIYPKGSSFFPWQVVEADGRGYLLMIGLTKEDGPTFGFGEVLADGTFAQWWSTPTPNGIFPRYAVGLKNAHAFYVNDPTPATGTTVYVFDVKHSQILCTRRFEAGLRPRGIVVDGELIYFYDNDGTTEICELDGNRQLVRIRRTEFDREIATPEGDFALDRIASTPGAHLCFYDNSIGPGGPGAKVRVLTRKGFPVTAAVSTMDWTWYYYARC